MVESVEVVIHQPGHPDRVVMLREGASRLGRAEDNEVVLSDVGVSRRHAQIYISSGEVTIEDLGSGNGTYYNGYRVQSQPLQDNDEVVIDPFVITFKITGQAPANTAKSSDSTPARLEVIVGTGMAGSSYPIQARGLSIGRSEDRDVVIPDPAASRHHCSILLQGDEYVLRDMGSANGIFVNAVRIRDCTLADGDLIRIGNTEMRFVRHENLDADTTTQVVPEDVWNKSPAWNQPPAGGIVPSIQPAHLTAPPSAPQKGGSGGVVAVALGSVFVIGAVLAVGVVAVIVVALVMTRPDPLPVIVPHPLAWSLDLPGGLESASADALFEAGVAKMRDGKNREALQDFYRVLTADAANMPAEKFSFAAGELMVLDALSEHHKHVTKARKDQDARRDKLLRDTRRSGRAGRDARAAIEEQFRNDPKAIEEMGWKKTPAAVALEKALAEATELNAAQKYVEADKKFRKVLKETQDPAVRKAALAGLTVCQRELARTVAVSWHEAIMLEATGQPGSQAKFEEVLSAHSTNPSAKLHVARLKR